MENLIEIKGVTHAYKTKAGPFPVLRDLNIAIPKHSFCAVVGPSGCGKSTLTRLIAGLMFPDQGEVWLHGDLVKSPRKTVGMAFQNPVLLEWRTILQNVILPLEIVAPSMPKAQKEARAKELLALVGLEGFENKRPSELSGGMRQRASLCRALVHKPDIIILDEPFGALDAFTREDLWQTMHQLREKEPFTALLITHDLRESVVARHGDDGASVPILWHFKTPACVIAASAFRVGARKPVHRAAQEAPKAPCAGRWSRAVPGLNWLR